MINSFRKIGTAMTLSAILFGCFDTSTNPTSSDSSSKNGSIYGTWRFVWVDGSNDTGTLNVTFFSPDSFKETATSTKPNWKNERSGLFIHRNDSLYIPSSFGSNGYFNYDSAEILRLDNSALVIRYNKGFSPYTMGFTRVRD
jgi:hypothetical protein